MTRVKRTRHGLEWRVTPGERQLLLSLLRQLDAALDGPVDDPVVERLFPQAVEDDPDEDDDLRQLLAGDLLLERHEAVSELAGLLERAGDDDQRTLRITLVEHQPWLVLRVLNDVRLAIGARVGFEVVESRPDDVDDGTMAALATLDLLAWFQEALLEHIDV